MRNGYTCDFCSASLAVAVNRFQWRQLHADEECPAESLKICSECAVSETANDRQRLNRGWLVYEPIVFPFASDEVDVAIECALHALAGAA